MSTTYLTLYDQTGDAEIREQFRSDHIGYRRSLGDALHMSGPLLNDEGEAVGSVIIFSAPDASQADVLATEDPYVKAGVLRLRSITPMRIARMVAPATT